MFFVALATDYDGTLAKHGIVDAATVEALERVKRSGRKLILVTGREVAHLLPVFPEVDVFDLVVAENGATLYEPASKQETALAPEPSAELVAVLKREGVEPLSVGRSIIATWEPNEGIVLDAIRDLGLELQIIFNKGAVMVLPAGINKASGLAAAAERLGLSPHNIVGVGDAENDHAFLELCGCGVAVSNALPALKEKVQYVTQAAAGAGVVELCELLIETDLAGIDFLLPGKRPALSVPEEGGEICLEPRQGPLLIAGSSGGGKTTTVSFLLERISALNFQYCVLDPEGDYADAAHTVALGSPSNSPTVAEVLSALSRPDVSAIVNLLAIPLADRPAFLAKLLPELSHLRTATGRPHWIVIDEAHHLLPADWNPAGLSLPRELPGLILVTVHPDQLSKDLLDSVETVIGVGNEPYEAAAQFCLAAGISPPPVIPMDKESRQAYFWPLGGLARAVTIGTPKAVQQRHVRKYAEGQLGEDLSFYFRGPSDTLNLRAQNLMIFMQIAAGIDEATWMHHLRQGDYSRWFAGVIKDDELADEARAIEQDGSLPAEASRQGIEEAISRRYTAPAKQ
jgi:HAD superfamily hydrolase (TIGR01484 family)